MANEVKSIAEHWDVLWVVVCGLFGVVIFLIWQTIRRIEKAVDHISLCMMEIAEKYVSLENFREWKQGRVTLWKIFNQHSHDHTSGRVIRNDDE